MSRLCLLVLLFLAATAAAQSQQSEIIPLPDASWQYHDGDDPRCGTVSGEGCTLQSAQVEESLSGPVVWVRSVVDLPDSLRAPQRLGVLIEGDLCFYEVFVNGHPIGSRGNLETLRGPYNSRAVFPFPSTLAQNGTLVVSVRASTLVGNLASYFEPIVSSLGPLELADVSPKTQPTTSARNGSITFASCWSSASVYSSCSSTPLTGVHRKTYGSHSFSAESPPSAFWSSPHS